MSQLENNTIDQGLEQAISQPKDSIIATNSALKAPQTNIKSPKKKSKKPLSKKAKTSLLAIAWIVLLGTSASIAFFIKPEPIIVHTNAIIEAYKFAESNTSTINEIVDDLDYYGYYTPNPLTFTPYETANYRGIYLISGLKNKAIEEKINNKIIETANTLHVISPDRHMVDIDVTANYFNLFSFIISQYDYNQAKTVNKYFTYDLNTGNELTFDSLFPKDINLTALLYKSFYDGLTTDIKFDRLFAERRLAAEAYAPDPTNCNAMYCPLAGETYDSLRALIANYDNQLANIEEYTLNTIKDYLAGEKRFYLNSEGPAFVLSDDRVIAMKLENNIRYAIYLKNFRSDNSIYENPPSTRNLFFTQHPYINYDRIIEETDTYLFDYVEFIDDNKDISPLHHEALTNYLKNRGLSLPSNGGNFRHILSTGSINAWNNVRSGYATLCANETDKSYYDSTYRKAVIDGKLQSYWMEPQQPALIGGYDEDRITQLSTNNNPQDCASQFHFIITNSGEILDRVDQILINPNTDSDSSSNSNFVDSWEDYLKKHAYSSKCHSSYRPICYTDEEKATHEFIYTFMGTSISINLKDSSESDSPLIDSINLDEIPKAYINPSIFIAQE